MDVFITWIAVMAKHVYPYIQIHQIIYINYVKFFVYFNKAVGKAFRRKKKMYRPGFWILIHSCNLLAVDVGQIT